MRALRFLTRDRFSLLDFGWIVPVASLFGSGRYFTVFAVSMIGAVIVGFIQKYAEGSR